MKIFAYLKRFPLLPQVLEALAREGRSVLAFVDSLDGSLRERLNMPNLRLVDMDADAIIGFLEKETAAAAAADQQQQEHHHHHMEEKPAVAPAATTDEHQHHHHEEAMQQVYEILGRRFNSGHHDSAERHNERQP